MLSWAWRLLIAALDAHGFASPLGLCPTLPALRLHPERSQMLAGTTMHPDGSTVLSRRVVSINVVHEAPALGAGSSELAREETAATYEVDEDMIQVGGQEGGVRGIGWSVVVMRGWPSCSRHNRWDGVELQAVDRQASHAGGSDGVRCMPPPLFNTTNPRCLPSSHNATLKCAHPAFPV